MDADPIDYHRYYGTLLRRRRRDVDPYRQYCMSAGLPLEAADFPVAWRGNDRRHPLSGVSDFRLADSARANSYTSQVG